MPTVLIKEVVNFSLSDRLYLESLSIVSPSQDSGQAVCMIPIPRAASGIATIMVA
jgi:hypothetical protein